MMINCPDCGKKVPKDKFCKNCGAYLADIVENEVTEIESISENENILPAAVNHEDINFCSNCGFKLTDSFNFCPGCGENLTTVSKSGNKIKSHSKEKNIVLAIILSVLLPGVGQIYLGLDHKGAIFLIAYIISVILILILIGFVLMTILWVWALVDTIISVNALNRGEEVEDKLL